MKFEIYRQAGGGLLGGEWRWRLVAGNGRTIASGESYHNKADCIAAIQLIMSTSMTTPMYEL